jgi:pimeloyl-ACP methyl ester carboxylesterase
MVKKTLLSLAIAASTAGLTACNISSTADNNEIDSNPVTSGQPAANGGSAANNTTPIFDPANTDALGIPNMPLITDLLFSGDADADGADGTIPFPAGDEPLIKGAGANPDYNPIFAAFADMDGFSTSGAIDIPFSAALDGTSIYSSGAQQNVFLVPLSYRNDPIIGGASTDDVEPALGATAAATLSAVPFDFANIPSVTATAISYSDSGSTDTNVLRIYPNEPLSGATRYLVVVTNGIKDASSNNVVAPTVIGAIARGVTPVDGSTGDLGAAIRGWLDLAEGFFGLSPTVDPAVKALNATNVVYTTTFTTGGTTEVLSAMTAPHLAIDNAALAQTAPASIRYLIEQELVKAPADQDLATLTTTLITAGLTQEQALGAIALASHLPQPAPRVATITSTVSNLGPTLSGTASALETGGGLTAEEEDTVAASAASISAISATIALANGSIKLPYYLSAPEGGASNPGLLALTATRSIASMWKADDTLGGDFSELLTSIGLTAADVTPPSSNVTRHFPFAKPGDHADGDNAIGYVDVPVSVIYDTACAGQHKPVIYQHGITSTRTPAIGFGAQLMARTADNCYATIAIDLPMHGWTPNNGMEKTLMSLTYGTLNPADAAINIGAGTFAQRHFGLTGDAGLPTAMFNEDSSVKDIASSGSLYINILNFQNTRDNNRQAVMDLMNLNASLGFISFKGDATPDFDLSAGVSFAGHSLGAITGTTFLAVNNALAPNPVSTDATKNSGYLNLVNAGVISNGGGQLTKLIENSPAFSPDVLDGFAALGTSAGLDLSQGSRLLETALVVFQGTVDSGDPINFASMLQATAPLSGVLAFEVVGNGTADTGPIGNTNPADLAVPNYTNPPLSSYDGNVDNLGVVDTAASPLGGSQPMHAEIGLTQVDATIAAGATPLRHVVRFTDGTHSSFGSASDGDPDNAGLVNGEMMQQSASFIQNSGRGLTIGGVDATIIQGVAE